MAKKRTATVGSRKKTSMKAEPAKAGLASSGEPLTPEQRREAKNAALREWRRKNADRHKAYMAAWRERRKAQGTATPAPAPEPSVVAPGGPAKATRSTKSKTPRKGGKK